MWDILIVHLPIMGKDMFHNNPDRLIGRDVQDCVQRWKETQTKNIKPMKMGGQAGFNNEIE